MYNYNKLIGKIIEVYGSRKNFAEAAKISKTSLSMKLNGKTEFKQEEMKKFQELLNLENIETYFF